MTQKHVVLLVALLTLAFSILTGPVSAEIPEPDHVVYGSASLDGAAVAVGTPITLVVDGAALASYTVGAETRLGELFALRVPLDAVGERRPGTARPGDRGNIFIGERLAGQVEIGERGTAQLLDVDPAVDLPAILIADAAVFEGDAGVVQVEITVSLAAAGPSPVEVEYATRNGTAESGFDYLPDAGRVVLPAGETNATFTVDVVGDLDPEGDEIFFVDLRKPVNGVLFDAEAVITIFGDDTPPRLSVDPLAATEPAPGEALELSFRARLSHAWDQDVSFAFAPRDVPGGAVLGSDYLLQAGTGNIPAGQVVTEIPVEILGDALDEDEEIFYVDLGEPQNALLGDGHGRGTISDYHQFLRFAGAGANGEGDVAGLGGAFAAALSPDGKHLYAAGRAEDSVVLFDRDPVSGALTYSRRYRDGIGGVDGLDGVEAVAVSADGRRVFTAAFEESAVAVFDRDPSTGELTLLDLERDGATDPDTGRTVEGLGGAASLVEAPSNDGDPQHLYVGGFSDNAVAVFSVATGGRLSFETSLTDGESGVDGLRQVADLAISPNGAHLYAAAFGDNAVAIFDRDPDDGFLIFAGAYRDGVAGVDGLAGALALAIPADGAHLYAAGQRDSAVTVFARDAVTGDLQFRQVVLAAAASFPGLAQVSDLATSRDPANGDYLYAAGFGDDALVVFSRGVNGELAYLETKRDGQGAVTGLDGAAGLAVSKDDLNVYVTASLASSIAVFERDLHAPSAPTSLVSSSHGVGEPNNNTALAFRWSGASDRGSGVAEYWLALDKNPLTLPPTASPSVNVPHGSDPHTAVLEAKAGDGDYHLHLRACDPLGNCTGTLHLGPFPIDTVAPGAAREATGAVIGETLLELTWNAAVDPSPGSGLGGYSHAVDGSPNWTCGRIVTLPAEATGAQVQVVTGTWYFHVCAVDEAGNWGPVVSVGPLEARDDTAPRVDFVNTVAGAPDGRIDAGERTLGAVTQLLLRFSETMAGGITDPASYRLLTPGPDGAFATRACTGDTGDDGTVPIDEVLYESSTSRVALRFSGGLSLSRSSYRLLVCAESLVDLSGNLLNRGNDYRLDFEVVAQNLLTNPNFDTGLVGWVIEPPTGYRFSSDDVDLAMSSGALELEWTGGTLALGQCVDLEDGEPLARLLGRARITQLGGTAMPEITGSLTWFSETGCGAAGELGAVATDPVIGDTAGAWAAIDLEAVRPARARSVLVAFEVLPEAASTSGDAMVSFDNLAFLVGTGLFADGFESGDTSRWSRAWPD